MMVETFLNIFYENNITAYDNMQNIATCNGDDC